jgi:hypothetical protein
MKKTIYLLFLLFVLTNSNYFQTISYMEKECKGNILYNLYVKERNCMDFVGSSQILYTNQTHVIHLGTYYILK